MVLLELLSSVFTAVLVGEVMSIVAHRRHINKAREERMDGIQALLFECDVPRDIRQQLRKWAVRAAWSRSVVWDARPVCSIVIPFSRLGRYLCTPAFVLAPVCGAVLRTPGVFVFLSSSVSLTAVSSKPRP